ncbi:hypothetical protein E2562_017497 [Oryza meyeriana var. granulata]|uniref:Uncharacterized protein n=1 Tax=Oryza meyeriana var. granulata TaxID=110450 RepID=A0A6G1E045_9ORYZ|nr:hypothetical protein E2562_017497 [Oryza meyeriana var. granulata]
MSVTEIWNGFASLSRRDYGGGVMRDGDAGVGEGWSYCEEGPRVSEGLPNPGIVLMADSATTIKSQ